MIPKVIHYCWVGGKPLPESVLACMETWKRFCPDYEIKEWNESNYDFTKNDYMREAYEAKKFGFVPDYARLDIIYQHGGIYLDTDVEVLKSFDSLLEYRGFCGMERETEYINLGQGFGAEQGNATIKLLRDAYDHLHFIKKDGSYDITPSPRINTEPLFALGFQGREKIQNCGELTVLPSDYLCPKSFIKNTIDITENTISIHHFDCSWFSERETYALVLKRKLSFLPKRVGGIIATAIAKTRYDGLKSCLRWVFRMEKGKE